MHVFIRDCVEVERMIVFRDQLRNDDHDRHLYERTNANWRVDAGSTSSTTPTPNQT